MSTSDRHTSTLTQLHQIVAGFSGTLGIAAKHLDTDESFAVNEHEVFPTASMIKICILVEVFRQRDDGRFVLTDPMAVNAEDKVGGSGILSNMTTGIQLPIRDIAVLMMALSDNTATNMLIDLVGIDAINRTIRRAGMTHTELRNKIDFNLIAKSNDNLAVGSPADFVVLLEGLATHMIVAPESADEILDIMGIQKYIEPIRRYLPYSPYAQDLGTAQHIRIASKTGGLSGVRCESALITLPDGRYILSVMGKECQDKRFTSDNEGTIAIATVSKLLYKHFTK